MQFVRDIGWQRVRHARYFENDVLYHVIFRTTQGLFFLNPDPQGDLRRIVAGVLCRARSTFPGVRNHATVVLSNHGHLAISGDATQLAAYVGFVKREISRRWGPRVGWRGIFEEGYHATAVLTSAAQRFCIKYIVSQTVKEGLVAHPEEWPGFHCAASLVSGAPVQGEWLDGTRYGVALHRAKRAGRESEVRRKDYVESCAFAFDPPPYLVDARGEDVRVEMRSIVDEVVAEARSARGERQPLGAGAVLAMSTWTRSELPPLPWFIERRRMVVWDNPSSPEVVAYFERYWSFQAEFRAAADRWRDGELALVFPAGSFRPGLSRPVPHGELRVRAA